MQAEATKEHAWLKKLAGEWAFVSECPAGPDGAPMRSEGRESVRMVGELWAVGEMTGEMPDGKPMTAILTLGFDPAKGTFVGTWIGSPMTHMFVYEGELDASGTRLTLGTRGPSCMGEGECDYQDIVELTPEGNRVLRSRVQGENGEWTEFMRAEFTRA